MCRHLAYLGAPVPVGELVTRGPHSLRVQSWAPREMRGGGTINADGFGAAWWHTPDSGAAEAGSPVVSRYRSAAPIWTDPAVEEVLSQIRSTAVLAAVRSATVGMPVERSACAPFTYGRWAFSHNGSISEWRGVLASIAAEWGSPSLLEAESLTDSAALWVILRGLLDGGSGAGAESAAAAAPGPGPGPEETGASTSTFSWGTGSSTVSMPWGAPKSKVWGWSTTVDSRGAKTTFHGSRASSRSRAERGSRAETSSGSGSSSASGSSGVEAAATGIDPGEALRRVTAAVLARSPKARLNFLLGDGENLWATTWHHALSVLETDAYMVVASEPYDDDPRWRPIADRQLVTVRGGRLSVAPLDIEFGRAGS